MNTAVGMINIGLTEHGVTRFAHHLAVDMAAAAAADMAAAAAADMAAAAAVKVTVTVLAAADWHDAQDRARELAGVAACHVNFTDQLFGSSCQQAAENYEHFVATLTKTTGAPVSVTLHDLPQPDDEPARLLRRRAAYARVVAATTGAVIVCSDSEADLLPAEAEVIPLPIEPPDRPRPTHPHGNGTDVMVLGFLYPGKGIDTAIDAAGVLGPNATVIALGQLATGHGDLGVELHRQAAALGRELVITGYLSEHALAQQLRRAGIPLAAHRAISASASIARWLTANRRPLVPEGPYTRELAQRCPGAVTLYEPTLPGLQRALAAAAADPASTWLADTVVLTPSRAQVAARYRAILSATTCP